METVMKPRMPSYAPSRMSTAGMVRYMTKYWLARGIASFLIRAVLWVAGMLLVLIFVPLVMLLVR